MLESSETSGRNCRLESSIATKSRTSHKSRKRNEKEGITKRPRVAQACEECRARKVRCDGGHPVCGPCKRRDRTQQECVYQVDRVNHGISFQYVARLENTIRRLVSAQSAVETETHVRSSVPVASDCVHFDNHDVQISQHPEEIIPIVESHPIDADELHRREDHVSRQPLNVYSDDCDTSPTIFSHRDEGVDGMGNTGFPENNYGIQTSSTASFMRVVKDSIAARLALPGSGKANLSQQSSHLPGMVFENNHPTLPTAELYMLPFRKTADEMVNVYFDQVHVLYPFLHRPSFMSSYNRLWADEHRQANGMLYCILNMIFAIYCQITKKDSPDDKGAAAIIFLRRAKQLLQNQLLEGGSLELVQALLLMGQFFQSSEWPHRCWVVIGIAIRVSQGLGLHLPKTTADWKDHRDTELARRLWHGCVFMDRMVSMTLGRPLMISRADALSVPLPSGTDDECLHPDVLSSSFQRPRQLSGMEFYIQSLRLFTITEETLRTMYSLEATYEDPSSPFRSPLEKLERLDFTTIIKIDLSLELWSKSLPQPLRTRRSLADELIDPTLSRQANILHLRQVYLQIQILLFRPILSLLLNPEVRSCEISNPGARHWLPQAIALPCAKNCILAALEAIHLIYSRQNKSLQNPPPVETLPAWWYEVFFVYTAATALIPARIYTHIRGDVKLSAVSEGWDRSLHILASLSPLSSSAKRCLAALQLFNDEIVVEESSSTMNNLTHGDNVVDASAKSLLNPRSESREGIPAQQMMQPLPDLMDIQTTQEDGFGVVHGMQDFAWLDSLPVDLATADFADLLAFGDPVLEA